MVMARWGQSAAVDPVAVAWLVEKGIWVRGASHAENMRRCMEAIERFKKLPPPEDGKAWAHKLIERSLAGESVASYALGLAMQVTGRQVPTLRKPSRPVPKPDAKEAAAGDRPDPDETVEEVWA